MRRFLLRWWAESCLLVPLLTCGCQHSQSCQATCDTANTVMTGEPVAVPADGTPVMEAPAPANVPIMPGAYMVPPAAPTAPTEIPTAPTNVPAVPTAVPTVPPVVPTTIPPVIHTTAKPVLPRTVDPMLSLAPPPYPSAAVPPEMRQSLPPVQPERQHSVPTAKAATEEPPPPRFGHDPSYHWLVGPIEYCRIQQAWLLRYVPVEEDDRYGGCVTLVTSNQKMDFKPGQIVRVEGALIDPDSQQLRPAFQVQTIRGD